MTPRSLAVIFALAVMLAGARAELRAQVRPTPPAPSSAAVWGDLVIPGGGAALVGLAGAPTAEEWRALPLLIESLHAGQHSPRLPGSVQAYITALQRLERQVRSVAPDRTVSLAMPARDKRRGDFDDLLETLGLRLDRGRGVVQARTGRDDRDRVAAFTTAGLATTGMAERLSAGEQVSLATTGSMAPLPLGEAFWTQRFSGSAGPRDLAWAILGNREAAYLYYGLLGLDTATLAAVQADKRLADVLVRRAIVLPAHARALRIRDGRVLPGGGDALGPLWEDLVGKKLDRPADFIDALLGTEDGRLAHFFATIDALPAGVAAFVAGDPAVKIGTRRQRFRELYSVFYAGLTSWNLEAGGFLQPGRGPSHALFALVPQNGQRIAGPLWRDFWQRVFDSPEWPADPRRTVGRIDERRRIDAADLLAILCPDALCSDERLAVVAQLQRVFPAPRLEDAAVMLAAARARLRYPALALEVERMALGDPSIYQTLGAFASRLEQVDRDGRAVSLVQFQGAIALLGRLRATGVPAEEIRAHLDALVRLPVAQNGFTGGVVRWVTSRLVGKAEPEDLDALVLGTLAGAGRLAPGAVIEWEGLRYQVDRAAAEERRMQATRERFPANPLSVAFGFLRAADRLPAAAGDASRTATWIAELDETLATSRDVGSVSWSGGEVSLDSFQPLSRELGQNVRKIRAGDTRRIERVQATLLAAADLAMADGLAALVYAAALQDPENPLALSRELPRRHQLMDSTAPGSAAPGWTVPSDQFKAGAARHARGSLLALDAGLAELARRRAGSARPDREPNTSGRVAEGLLRAVGLTTVWNVTDSLRDSLHAAEQRGAAVIASATDMAQVDRWVTEASIAGPRAGYIRWANARSRLAAALPIRLEDRIRLGAVGAAVWWGAAPDPSGCLCTRLPVPSWEQRGQPADHGLASELVAEPALRVMQELSRRRLPAVLAPAVLAIFVTELIEQASLPHMLDVEGIAAWVRQVPSGRFDDYIAAVAARGPLVPVQTTGGSAP
jgi:hypothetical protein